MGDKHGDNLEFDEADIFGEGDGHRSVADPQDSASLDVSQDSETGAVDDYVGMRQHEYGVGSPVDGNHSSVEGYDSGMVNHIGGSPGLRVLEGSERQRGPPMRITGRDYDGREARVPMYSQSLPVRRQSLPMSVPTTMMKDALHVVHNVEEDNSGSDVDDGGAGRGDSEEQNVMVKRGGGDQGGEGIPVPKRERRSTVIGTPGFLPPHEIVAKSLTTHAAESGWTDDRGTLHTFSVCEGAGRVLRGRESAEVRQAVLRQTGFL